MLYFKGLNNKCAIASLDENRGMAIPLGFRIVLRDSFVVLLLAMTLIFFSPTIALAQTMKSTDYEIIKPNLNFSSGFVSGSGKIVGFTGGQLASGPSSSTGVKLWAGFWYIKNIIPFSFSVSNNVVEFGTLASNDPKTAKTTIIVSAGGAGGYQVTAQENYSLMVLSTGARIKDVIGDNDDITESNAGDWVINSTDGFGYSLSGDDVPSPFPTRNPVVTPTLTMFKQFSNTSLGESPEIIMSSSSVGKDRTLDLFYKININPLQDAGRYQNVITYIATPTY
jgi:hypothetical protein